MNFFNVKFVSFLIALAASSSIHAANYTWVDEKGKMHFGDIVPPQYKDVAKQIEEKPLNLIAPEARVRALNDAAAAKYRREDAIERSKTRQAKEKQQDALQKQPLKYKVTREFCRDSNLRTKERTACFKAAAEQE